MKENRIDSIEKKAGIQRNSKKEMKKIDKAALILGVVIMTMVCGATLTLWDAESVQANNEPYRYEFIYYESENGTIRTIQLTDYYYKGCVEYSGLSQAIEDMHKDGFRKYVQSYDLRNHHVAIIFEKQTSE